MKYRKHQSEMDNICLDIQSGQIINKIIGAITPGGGKSKLPVILCDRLIPLIADKLCWIVPRNSLKYQGESEFIDDEWPTNHRIRAAGNEIDPSRGSSGYVTTYQAIGQNPERHAEEFDNHDYILFLDEPHHISEDSSWEKAIKPLVDKAKLVIYASGTFSRGDGKRISFIDYRGSYIDTEEKEHTKIISYSRSEALEDGAICPIYFKTIDGRAEWEEGGVTASAKLSTYTEDGKALYTVLRTEYAMQLLKACYNDWINSLDEFPEGKLLVIAPDIKTAKKYYNWFYSHHSGSRIATSEDTQQAKENINLLKKGIIKILITVGMAYEGLSVKEINRIACLTHIRSVPWIEQAFARGNRLFPGKKECIIYGPEDQRFLKSIRMIENEQLSALKKQSEKQEIPGSEEGESGEGKPYINPLSSTADIQNIKEPVIPSFKLTPSEEEKYLRSEIQRIKTYVLADKKNGAKQTASRLLSMRIKNVCDKQIKDMSIDELTEVWMFLRKNYQMHLTT
jgi:superfamily II DNA or RNA helicase